MNLFYLPTLQCTVIINEISPVLASGRFVASNQVTTDCRFDEK